jgi:small membrane protein
MIIQVFLSVLLVGVAALVALQGTTSRLLKGLVLGVVAMGAFFVWVPEATHNIAEAFGVGRGADLVLYLWVVITLALIVFLYLKVARLSQKLTRLARAVALGHARTPDSTKQPEEYPS